MGGKLPTTVPQVINPVVLMQHLSPAQKRCIKVAQAANGLGISLKQIAAMARTSHENLYRWIREVPSFRLCWDAMIPLRAKLASPAVMAALEHRASASGDPKAAALILGVAGYAQAPQADERPTTNVQVNIDTLTVQDLEQYRTLLAKMSAPSTQAPPPQ